MCVRRPFAFAESAAVNNNRRAARKAAETALAERKLNPDSDWYIFQAPSPNIHDRDPVEKKLPAVGVDARRRTPATGHLPDGKWFIYDEKDLDSTRQLALNAEAARLAAVKLSSPMDTSGWLRDSQMGSRSDTNGSNTNGQSRRGAAGRKGVPRSPNSKRRGSPSWSPSRLSSGGGDDGSGAQGGGAPIVSADLMDELLDGPGGVQSVQDGKLARQSRRRSPGRNGHGTGGHEDGGGHGGGAGGSGSPALPQVGGRSPGGYAMPPRMLAECLDQVQSKLKASSYTLLTKNKGQQDYTKLFGLYNRDGASHRRRSSAGHYVVTSCHFTHATSLSSWSYSGHFAVLMDRTNCFAFSWGNFHATIVSHCPRLQGRA